MPRLSPLRSPHARPGAQPRRGRILRVGRREEGQSLVEFALILTPLLFTGAVQYPWPSLSHLRWFQIVALFNPMTYVSEGLRGAMVPQVPHMRPWICVRDRRLSENHSLSN